MKFFSNEGIGRKHRNSAQEINSNKNFKIKVKLKTIGSRRLPSSVTSWLFLSTLICLIRWLSRPIKFIFKIWWTNLKYISKIWPEIGVTLSKFSTGMIVSLFLGWLFFNNSFRLTKLWFRAILNQFRFCLIFCLRAGRIIKKYRIWHFGIFLEIFD